MTMFKRWVYGGLAIAVLTGPAGLLLRNVMSQEGHEEARPIVVNQEEGGENPFEARRDREREERERPEARERNNEERPTERDVLRRQVEVLKIALHGLMEAEKRDAAEVVQRAIRAREVTLEERRDDEAHMIRERAPNRGQLAEILTMASNLWREFNNQDKADIVGRLAKEMAGTGEREREQPPRERREAEERERPRTEAPPEEAIRRQLHELEQAWVQAREAGRLDEAERLRNQMREVAGRREQAQERRPEAAEPVRRPAVAEASRAAEEVERLKGSVRELGEQINQMRREMSEIRRMLEVLAEQKRGER